MQAMEAAKALAQAIQETPEYREYSALKKEIDADAAEHRRARWAERRNILGRKRKHRQVEPDFRPRSPTCLCSSSRRDTSFIRNCIRRGNGKRYSKRHSGDGNDDREHNR